MMIELRICRSGGYARQLVLVEQVESITEASPSSQYHGIRAYVRMKGGVLFECADTVYEITNAIQQAQKQFANYSFQAATQVEEELQTLRSQKAKLRFALQAVMARFDPMATPGLELNEAAYKLAQTALEETK